MAMIVIADSGSTKTDWMLCNTEGYRLACQTAGINPHFQTSEAIVKQLQSELAPVLENEKPVALFFYGAGCTAGAATEQMEQALSALFPTTIVSVASDLLGAARALWGSQSGIAAILGTGSNSCFYDGQKIAQQVSPLGFILGDEGSGAYLGKRLVADVLKNQLPPEICRHFWDRFELTQADIIRRVYTESYPNRFLASLAPFLYEHREDSAIKTLLLQSFTAFFTRNVCQYDYVNQPVGIVGSVGFYFDREIREAAAPLHITITKIDRAPMPRLIEFHLNNQR